MVTCNGSTKNNTSLRAQPNIFFSTFLAVYIGPYRFGKCMLSKKGFPWIGWKGWASLFHAKN